jgi:hypothetical protein
MGDTERLARYDRLARQYKWVTWLGIVLNSLFSLPLMFAPRLVLDILKIDVEPLIFARIVGMFLLWLSIFYIPAAMDLKKYRVFAWLAIFPSRAGGAIFFLSAVLLFGYPMGYIAGGILDLSILLMQLVILLKVRAVERPRPLIAPPQPRRGPWILAGSLAALAIVVGAVAWHKFLREVDQKFASMEEYFKYGSIGTEQAQGIPYWIWIVLPRVFPEHLPRPGGYNALGLHNEPGNDMPVGFSVKTIGFPRVGINCALCHSATIRLSADEQPRLLVAGGTTTFDALSYQRFLFKSASDPRFNGDTIIREIDRNYQLPWLDRALYKYVLVPAVKKALLEQKAKYAWTDIRPAWGPGRIDPFNPVKALYLGVDVGKTIGNSDMVPIWNVGAIANRAYHWDGLNPNLVEVVRSSAIGDGATAKSVPLNDLQKLQDWLVSLAPPKYPSDRFSIDSALATSGRGVFERECAVCHGPGGAQTGQIVPIEVVGTDPHRIQMWTPESAAAYNTRYKDNSFAFSQFRSTNGYVSVPLDALWTRAPYLHNGSVPSLRDMLRAPADRPKLFYRGYNVFDPNNVGFVSQGPDAEREGFRYDVAQPGNSNQGHLFGTQLPERDKDALVEYLKTL